MAKIKFKRALKQDYPGVLKSSAFVGLWAALGLFLLTLPFLSAITAFAGPFFTDIIGLAENAWPVGLVVGLIAGFVAAFAAAISFLIYTILVTIVGKIVTTIIPFTVKQKYFDKLYLYLIGIFVVSIIGGFLGGTGFALAALLGGIWVQVLGAAYLAGVAWLVEKYSRFRV
jgi:hypothetical protein